MNQAAGWRAAMNPYANALNNRAVTSWKEKYSKVQFGGFISNSRTDLLLLCYYFHGLRLVLSVLAEGCNNMDSNH